MGLVTDKQTGLGNTSKPNVRSLSGVSADDVNIYNYNKITLHMNPNGGKPAPEQLLVLENKGCYHNGTPIWSYEDGIYDGDYDTSSDMGRLHHHNRFGSAICAGQSHQLRWGGYGSTGSWEILTHGRVSAWTSATTKNFFGIQGTGNTETGVLNSTAVGSLGTWSVVSANTTIQGVAYGIWINHSGGTAADDVRAAHNAANMNTISATTAFGVIL
jgi:hypothetical protein|tara:strand:+ start:5349 stop:5993 length:645 start_codon:yes stop_codon:yes gene_type:complete